MAVQEAMRNTRLNPVFQTESVEFRPEEVHSPGPTAQHFPNYGNGTTLL